MDCGTEKETEFFTTLTSLTLTSIEEPISFNNDPLCSDYMILLSSEKFIMKLQYAPESTDGFYYKIEYLRTPTNRPITAVNEKCDMVEAYRYSNIMDKQTISLDPLYAAEFTDQEIHSQIKHICFVRLDPLDDPVAAVVTNFGQCEILKLNFAKRSWELCSLSLNDLWNEVFPSANYTNLTNFENIRQYIEDYVVSMCCWIDPGKNNKRNYNILICSTISGCLVAFKILENKIEYLFKFQTDFYKINHLQSMTYVLQNGTTRTVVLASNIDGQIKLYKFDDNFTEIAILWIAKDKITSKLFVINYCSDHDLLMVATTKAAHLLIFVLGSNNKKLFTGKYLCDTQIKGFDSINPYEYLIGTYNGITKHIKLTNTSIDKFSLICINIRNDFDSENYSVRGMVATRNRVSWIILFYPQKKYIHMPTKKDFVLLNAHIYNKLDSLEMIKNLTPKQYSDMLDYTDCNETIRSIIQKKNINDTYVKFEPGPVQLTKTYLHQLRIRLVIVKAIGGYSYLTTQDNGKSTQIIESSEFTEDTEIFNLNVTIKAVWAYSRLEYLKQIAKPTNFQQHAAKCIRNILSEYLIRNLIEKYSKIRAILAESIKKILKQTEYLADYKEICIYCSYIIDIIHPEGCSHNYPRCCITFVQIPDIEMKSCGQCNSVALNDDSSIREILSANEKIRCTFCACPLI